MSFHSAVQKQERTNAKTMASNAFLQPKCDCGRHADTLITLAASDFGHDFSKVPLHTSEALPTPPSRRAPLTVQRFPRNEDEVSAPCPNCPEAEQAPPAPEAAPTPAESEPTAEAAVHEETPSPGLIVDDSAAEAGPGQMRKSEFLDALQVAVCAAADAELTAVGRTAEGCPYIERWIGYYRMRSSGQIERAIGRYAPETAGVRTAGDYIPLIAERVRRAVAVWATTGEITGVPEGASATPPETAAAGETPAEADVQRKSRDGGVSQTGDPAAVRARLGSGRSLEHSVRSRMETAFGHDFSRVHVHTDAEAAGLSRSLNARAFTVGSDVAFGSGEYQPGTLLGDALIAHELAHTIQQEGAGVLAGQLQRRETSDNSLEGEADESAIRVIVPLWCGAKGALTEISRNALPRLRSGLRLARCKEETTGQQGKVKEAKEGAPAAKAKEAGVTRAADMTCEPEAKTLEEMRNIPGSSANTLGYTKPAPVGLDLTMASENGKCKLNMTKEPRLAFSFFAYVKAGDYKVGRTKIPFDPCKEKDADYYWRLTPQMSDKVRKGEIEHCEDGKRAFQLSFERYAQAVREVASVEFPGKNVPACQTETLKRLKEKIGIEVPQWKPVADCLFDKTLERDKAWHKVDPDPTKGSFELTTDCRKITFIFDHVKQLNEVGKHPPKDVVKGCGEK